MTDGVIYQAGWTLNDIPWPQFDPSKVNPALPKSRRQIRSTYSEAAGIYCLNIAVRMAG